MVWCMTPIEQHAQLKNQLENASRMAGMLIDSMFAIPTHGASVALGAPAARPALPPAPAPASQASKARVPRAPKANHANDAQLIVAALQDLDGEQTIGQIHGHFESWPKERLHAAMRAAVGLGIVAKSGEKRGTRYSLASAPLAESEVPNDPGVESGEGDGEVEETDTE